MNAESTRQTTPTWSLRSRGHAVPTARNRNDRASRQADGGTRIRRLDPLATRPVHIDHVA